MEFVEAEAKVAEPIVERTKVEVASVEVAEVAQVAESAPVVIAEESVPRPTSRRVALSSGFSLKEALSKSGKSSVEQSEQDAGGVRRIDPATEQKLQEASGAIVELVASTRPRFRPFFEVMKITPEAIELVVPTSELELEIRRAEIEMMAKIVELAKVNGYVELRIEVNEEETKSRRPIKLEDRVTHFAELNPLIAELAKALDLQIDS